MFHMPNPSRSSAWAQLLDPQGFSGTFGPTTVKRRSPWFMFDAATGCCHWDGPMWPYSASQTLTGMANLLIDYPPQPYVTKNDYYSVLSAYAFAQQKNGRPYVAEAHDPDNPVWIYDSFNHSEDYNHSTFNDLVLSGLLGIRPQLTDIILVHPLVPDSWDHFAIENLPYHGRNLTVLWDKDGSNYHQGAGLRVYVDGQLSLV
jgi:Mannosylglycerate hydrolase MGH1-like glycoside hydrolase domain/Glycosyl hydrolase family 65, C-terminal domain